jgi:acyl-CoA synthetase (AMP-forming)/AMP-acid ligase II/acetyl-CoA acetyltransferase
MTGEATIAAVFRQTARRHANQPFLHAPPDTSAIYGLAKTDFTYREAAERVDELIKDYRSLGCAPGCRIGLALENRPEFFLHFLAVNALGGSVMPLNCGMQGEELSRQVAHSAAALLVSTPGHYAKMAAAAARVSPAPPVVEAMALENVRLGPSSAAISASGAEQEAAILYTSGTTGTPKGCILSNDYFLAIGDFYTALGGHVQFEEGRERIITPLPVTHMNALACSFMAAIWTGGCLVQLDRFHPKSWWASVRESRATIMHYLGVMPAMLLGAPPSPDDDFSGQLKFAFGAGCDPRHHEAFEQRFGVKLVEAWAMTETGAGAWITASHEPRHVGARYFGRAPAGLEWRLVDEAGRDAPVGEPGELLVRRAGSDPRRHFFSGYYRDEAATEEAWKGGWFHTGDVVRVDAYGGFYFIDRRKNVIRRSGENIAAIEVESVLSRCDSIAAVVIAPVPDEVRGEEVMALVVPRNGCGPAESRAIFDFAMANLIYFKAPGYIAFVDAIPMTATEKVKRADVKALARDLLSKRLVHDFTAEKKQKRALKRATTPRLGYDGVVAAAPTTIPYERRSEKSAHWWIGRALRALAERTGLSPAAFDGFIASSFTLHPDTAVALTQHFGLSPRWLDHVPMGGASGVVALQRAARAVGAGDADVVACVAGDTNDPTSFGDLVSNFSRFSREAAYPCGAAGPNMSFALMTRAYMSKYGATREDFGKICVAQRRNALEFPYALMKAPLTLDAYLNARPIAEPLHLFDCVMPCAGAEAFIVTREETARAMHWPFARILSTIERHNAFKDDHIQLRGGWAIDKDELWAMAGVKPDEVDFLQTYDDYPVVSMMQIEDLGFCAKGEAKDFIRAKSLTVGGDFPHNTSGGQLSVGQAGAAGGYLGLVEALRQLTGETLGPRVEDAKIGVVSGFGMVNFDRGICSAAAILAAGGRHG